MITTTHDAIDRFVPVFDGNAIPHQTWTPHAPAEAHDIPLLIGNTTHESAAFIGTALETPDRHR